MTGALYVSCCEQATQEEDMSLGRRLFELREKKAVPLQEVADAVSVSKAHIWELEKERKTNPSMALVTRLADYYRVSVSYLVGEDADAKDADAELAGMFRQASDLDENDRKIFKDMMQSLLKNLDD
jgi:transcriptional regulator with XRE-family HTH domain